MPALEEVVAENNVLMRELIEVLKARPLAVTASASAPAGDAARRGPGRPKVVTLEEVTAVAQKLATVKTQPVAAKLIAKIGGGKLANMPKEKYAEFIAAAETAINTPDEEPGEDDSVL